MDPDATGPLGVVMRACTCTTRDRVDVDGRRGTIYRVVHLADDTLLYVFLDEGQRLTVRCAEAHRVTEEDLNPSRRPCLHPSG